MDRFGSGLDRDAENMNAHFQSRLRENGKNSAPPSISQLLETSFSQFLMFVRLPRESAAPKGPFKGLVKGYFDENRGLKPSTIASR